MFTCFLKCSKHHSTPESFIQTHIHAKIHIMFHICSSHRCYAVIAAFVVSNSCKVHAFLFARMIYTYTEQIPWFKRYFAIFFIKTACGLYVIRCVCWDKSSCARMSWRDFCSLRNWNREYSEGFGGERAIGSRLRREGREGERKRGWEREE